MKHAYLISAHNNFLQLSFLIELLDDARNDIFIFIDKKNANAINKEILKIKYSKLYIYSKFAVNWGGVFSN